MKCRSFHLLVFLCAIDQHAALKVHEKGKTLVDPQLSPELDASPFFGEFDLDEIESLTSDFNTRVAKVQTPEPGFAALKSLEPETSLHLENLKKAIHLHIHNAAGTYMCSMAKAHGEAASMDKGRNCNMNMDDGPFNVPDTMPAGQGRKDTCADRLKEMKQNKLSFSMIEREIDSKAGDWCPNDFLYTIIVRDPVKRAITTMEQNFKRNKELAKMKINEGLQGKTMKGFWVAHWPAFSDLMVRSLNGPDAMKLPIGGLNATHLQFAKQRLSEFHAVLAVPTLAADFVQLVDVLGWSPSNSMKQRERDWQPPPPGASRNEKKLLSEKNRTTDDELDRMLFKHNYWDRQLYSYGMELAKERTDALLRQCKHPGFCSKDQQ